MLAVLIFPCSFFPFPLHSAYWQLLQFAMCSLTASSAPGTWIASALPERKLGPSLACPSASRRTTTCVHACAQLLLTPTPTHVHTRSQTHTQAPTRSLTHSLTHSHTHTHTHSLTHSLTHTLTHTLTHSLTHTHTHSHSHTHSLARSSTHSLTHSLTHCLACGAQYAGLDSTAGLQRQIGVLATSTQPMVQVRSLDHNMRPCMCRVLG